MPRPLVAISWALLAGAATAGPGYAQETRPVCLLGFAYPRCRTIPVLDVTVRASPGFEPAGHSSPLSTTLELGWIVNLTPRHSAGVVGGFLFDADFPAGLVRARYRYWPHWFWPLELSAGVLIDRGGRTDVAGAGLIVEAATSFADIVALTAALEHRPRDGDDSTLALFGVRFGLQTLAVPSYLLPDW